jgi:predicted nucleic acid-binding protein
MYLLDTNVVAELRKAKAGKADKNVTAWAESVVPSSLFLSAITVLELELGVLLMERRDHAQGASGAILRSWMDGHVLPAFAGRILPIDAPIARRCAELHVPDPKSERDAFIAATALVHGMTVVTRNVDDFTSTDVAVLNPWGTGDIT